MLEANQVSYTVQNKALIHRISLSFQPGVLYGIVGPNGSGKTTLLKTLAGLWPPTHGEVRWQGQPLHEQSRQTISQTLTLVPQNPLCDFAFTAYDLVAMGRYPHGGSRKRDHELIEWALRTVDGWQLRDRSVPELSGGERQRIYIARSLVTESPVILLDEPTSSLDIGHQLDIWRLLKRLVQQERTIIVTTHDLNMTECFADNVALMHQGHCVGSGTFDEVITSSVMEEVFGVTSAVTRSMSVSPSRKLTAKIAKEAKETRSF